MSKLPEQFTAVNTESSVEVELSRIPSGCVGDMGRFRATWRDGGQEFTNWYDYDVIVRQVQNGKLKIKFEGENMKLPDIFYFTAYRDPLVYSATRKGDEYVVAWWDARAKQFKDTTYTVFAVQREIGCGSWKVDPKSFVESSVLEQDTFEPGIINFQPMDIPQAMCVEISGPELLTEDPDHGDLAVDLPPLLPSVFDFSGLSVNFVWFDELVETGLTLAEVTAFAQETGFRIEACEDFYTVRKEGNYHTYVVGTEQELREVMNAIRVLQKASDNG